MIKGIPPLCPTLQQSKPHSKVGGVPCVSIFQRVLCSEATGSWVLILTQPNPS